MAASARAAPLTALLLLCLAGALCDQNVYPTVGTLFVHELDAEDYQQQFLNKDGDESLHPVSFQANLRGYPDLPRWLRYTQRWPGHSAYLYGSPTKPGKQIIEITAYNRHTYETLQERIVLHIRAASDLPPPYRAEILVKNLDVEEMLPPEAQHSFQVFLQDYWRSPRLSVINITSALDKGGRVPLPLPDLKEGVFIQVGSFVPFPKCFSDTRNPQIRRQCQEGQKPQLCPDLSAEIFAIDWCNVSLIDDPEPSPTPRSADALDFKEEFNPPAETVDEINYLPDYLLTLLLPTIVALVLCLLLSYIMCCRREGVKKRDAETSELQLVHQQSIFSNTEELRKMASTREVPRPLSTLPMFNVRTGQRTSPMELTGGDSSRVPLILSQE